MQMAQMESTFAMVFVIQDAETYFMFEYVANSNGLLQSKGEIDLSFIILYLIDTTER